MNEEIKQYIYAALLIGIIASSYLVYTWYAKEEKVEILIEEIPEGMLVGEKGSVTFTVKNNTEESKACSIEFESEYLETNATFEEELCSGGTSSFTVELSAKRIDTTSKKVDLTIVAQAGGKKYTKNVKITIKKPEVFIGSVKPNELKVKVKSTEYISVKIKNKEKSGLKDLKIKITSAYEHYFVERTGIEKIDTAYIYNIDETLLYNEEITKTFYITSDLPPGITSGNYQAHVQLLWKNFLIDEKEIRFEVNSTES
ncbi:MAG: hypothetical protein U9N35_02375 [Euryarchaeota archaeon]|nr:hypothetical protein [Euryarchaeota archaeon]